MKRGVFITFAMILIPWFLQAQVTPGEPQNLSLGEAVSFAVSHNKELQASQMDIELRNKMVQEAISQGLPQINGSLNYSTNFGYEVSLGGGIIKMQDQSNLGVSVSQLLFNGQWLLGIQTSKIAKTIASQQVDLTELDIKEYIYNSYYTILVSERLMGIVKMNLENMNQILTHTDNMYKAGTAEITDVDQIRVTVGQLKNSLLAMQRTVDVNYNLLRLQLGLQAGTPVKLTDQLESFLTEDGFLKLAVQNFDINNNSQYKLMQTQEDLQKKMVGLKKWTYAPDISASYNYQYQIKKGGFMNIPHSAAITMNIPVFSGLQRKSQLDQEKITLEQTTLNKSLLEDQLNLQEEQYKFSLKNALEDYALQKENIIVAKKVLDNYQYKYKAGVVSSLDMTQANNNYLQAENNYTSACLTLLQSQTQLQKLYSELK